MEDTLSQQTAVVGSAMRFYEHMQAARHGPAHRALAGVHHGQAGLVRGAASSAGASRLTETYGCTGWDFPFAGHKALGDWQAALGINLRCQHLAWYTMEAEAKRDYPAAISWQSPWWQAYPKVEDYFARINAVTSRGAEVRDLLVVHPVESTWLMVRPGWLDDPAVKRFDLQLVALEDALLAAARGLRLRRRGDPLAQGRRGEGEERAGPQGRQGRLHRGARAADDHAALHHPRAARALRRRGRTRGVRGRSRGPRGRRAVRPAPRRSPPARCALPPRARSWSRRSSPPGGSPSPIPRATRSPRRCTC